MNSPIARATGPQDNSRLVCRFANQLTVLSGVRVGARRRHGRWQILWSNGPSVIAMRRHAADLGDAVVGVDLLHLTWQRTTRALPSASHLVIDVEPDRPASD